MEAAALLPVLMLLVALLVQPVCLLYTYAVMNHAAAGALRVLATTSNERSARAYALRRLGAVPEVSLFHVGGSADWNVSVSREPDRSVARVSIVGHARPLPLLLAITRALGAQDGEGVVLSVELSERVRPSWLGGDYEDWMLEWQ